MDKKYFGSEIENPIATLLESAATIEASAEKLACLRGQVSFAKRAMEHMEPVEKISNTSLQIVRELSEEELRTITQFGMYKRIDLRTALRWRDGHGMPRIVLFDLEHPTIEFRTHISCGILNCHIHTELLFRDNRNRTSRVPRELSRYHEDVFSLLKRRHARSIPHLKGHFGTHSTISAEARFVGMIPHSIRRKARMVQRNFRQGVFLLTKAPVWFREKEIQRKEMLLVGINDTDYYLIDTFTPFKI